jgi:excisionase family DNA binding protein
MDAPLTAVEVADLLGCSRRTVMRKADAGEIPATRLGPKRLYVFDRTLIATYLADLADQAAHLAEQAAS